MISLNRAVFSFKIYFSFSFCSDFNLQATVVTPCFLLIGKKFYTKIINN